MLQDDGYYHQPQHPEKQQERFHLTSEFRQQRQIIERSICCGMHDNSQQDALRPNIHPGHQNSHEDDPRQKDEKDTFSRVNCLRQYSSFNFSICSVVLLMKC